MTLQSVLIEKSKFVKAPHRMQKIKENCNTEVHGGGGLELVNPARDPASSGSKTCKQPRNLARSLLLVGPRKKKTDRNQRSAFPSGTSRFAPLILAYKEGSALPCDSSTIELPTTLTEYVAYSTDTKREMIQLLCVLLRPTRLSATVSAASSRRAPSWSLEEAYRVNTTLNQSNRRRISTNLLNRADNPLVVFL